MDVVRKLLIFIVLTAGLIALGRLAGRLLPRPPVPSTTLPDASDGSGPPPSARDSGNALSGSVVDTGGGRWHERLFDPLERANGLGPKSLRRKSGYYEIIFPKGKPLYEYALEIEKISRANGITVAQGSELRPPGRIVEYVLESDGQRIKLRAALGGAVLVGAARLAVVFTGLDSLSLAQAAALKDAGWEKNLVLNPYNPNPALRAFRDGDAQDAIIAELPMEPSAYPYIDPGKHALYIHHNKEDVERILREALDSLPKAEGFASRYGDRAIENRPLLDKLFQFTARRKLIFLDLTGSPRSLARRSAAAQGARSRSLILFRDSAHVEEELARKTALAQKSGEAVLALPYSDMALRNLSKAIAANVARFNEIGLELVDMASLSAPDTLEEAAEKPLPAKPGTTAGAKANAAAKSSATLRKPAAAGRKTPADAKSAHAKSAATASGKTHAKGPGKPAVLKPAAKPAAKTMKDAKRSRHAVEKRSTPAERGEAK